MSFLMFSSGNFHAANEYLGLCWPSDANLTGNPSLKCGVWSCVERPQGASNEAPQGHNYCIIYPLPLKIGLTRAPKTGPDPKSNTK